MVWLRNKKNNFHVRIFISGPVSYCRTSSLSGVLIRIRSCSRWRVGEVIDLGTSCLVVAMETLQGYYISKPGRF